MLPRARPVLGAERVQSFQWDGPGGEPQTALAGVREAVTDPVAQQTHLAALEREAFTKGHAQGERAGLEAGGKRAEAMLRRLAQTIAELADLRATMVRQTERQLVQLAIALAERILRTHVTVDADLMMALARVALERLGSRHPATVRLHPEDHAVVVGQKKDEWAGAHVQIIADSAISRGGCRVESDFGLVEAGIDAQLGELAKALLAEEVLTAPQLTTHGD